jgi:hypothetical protein
MFCGAGRQLGQSIVDVGLFFDEAGREVDWGDPA